MRTRNLIGIVAGVLLLLSAGAHGFLGWPGMLVELGKTDIPPALLAGVRIGWLFGSVAMLAFGLVLLVIFDGRRRGEPISTLPALIIGVLHGGFGLWAWVGSGFEPFYLVFVVPGVLAVIAALGASRTTA